MYSQGLVEIHDKSYNNNFSLINDSTEWVITMSLRAIIEDKYKNAIKAKETNEINTLRLIKSAIKDRDISCRSGDSDKGIADLEILSLMQSLIKQRKDSIDSFKAASRNDLIAIEQAEIDGVMVVNKPSSLRDANEKLFALNFPDYIPETLVSSNIEQLIAFINDNEVVVVKPLDGMGGKGIYKLKAGDENINKILLKITNQGQRYIMAQEFLPGITQGDKRILLINGIPIDYALARLPKEGSFKGNLAAGAKGIGQSLTKRDRYLCEKIAPILIEKDLIFVGLDVIGDYITEINVTSPTCIRELDKQFGLNISAQLLDVIEERLALR